MDTPRPLEKILVVVRDDLKPWQELNVAIFLVSGVALARPDLVGEPYRDAGGTAYLAMFGQPVMVLAASADVLSTMRERARVRRIPAATFTDELFATGNYLANRAPVRCGGDRGAQSGWSCGRRPSSRYRQGHQGRRASWLRDRLKPG